MGLGLFKMSGCDVGHTEIPVAPDLEDILNVVTGVMPKKEAPSDPRNPDPSNYKILKVQEHRKYTTAKVQYLNCTNYEGIKILVFDCAINELLPLTQLDPHFCEGDHISPIARFEPTDQGWFNAIAFMEAIS